MSSTPEELFRAALRQYAKQHGGKYVATQYICVPHQLPPRVVDADTNPPETEGDMPDQYVTGDHDAQTVMPLIDGLTYSRHQWPRVRAMAERELDSVLPDHWRERVLCQMFSGSNMFDFWFRHLSRALTWDGIWPVVDGERNITGGIVESEDGYASVCNEAMMLESDAKAAGLVVEEGRVHLPLVS